MKSYKITWVREQFGETIIKAKTKEIAEEKAEIGEHEKVKSISNEFEDWTISNVEEIK